MFRTTVGLTLAVAACAAAQNAGTLDAVARAMGGRDRIAAVRTLVLEGRGDNFNLGQNLTPTADLPRFEVTQYRRSIDFAGKRWQQDQTREPRFATGNVAPQRQRQGADGDIAYNIGNDGNMNRVFGQTAIDRSLELLYHPVGLLQAALAPGAEVFDEAGPNNTRLIRTTPGGNKFAMVVDTRTNLPLRIERMVYHAMLGDVMLFNEFDDWRDVNGLRLPMRLTQRLAGAVISDLRIATATVNTDVGDLAASAAARAQVAPPRAAPVVNVEQIAPGIWYLNGQSHHTVAIEQQRSIVLVEAPQNDDRMLAVIAKARTLVPGKPVDAVINTHHHFDHSGGVRAAISQGLTVLTHEANRDFYERTLFPARHLIVSDTLARNPKPLRLMALGDRYVRGDSLRTIETYHLAGNQHSGGMLVVYLPAERMLIQADIYTPPAPNAPPVAFPFAANLADNVQRRGLQVDRVIGIHGRVVPFSEIQSVAR